jgi:16S rRNA (cytosine967-C5)-methyltransferase
MTSGRAPKATSKATSKSKPARTATPREVALDALVRVEDGAFANVLLPTLLRSSGMEQRERAQTTELVYGTLRRRRSLDALLDPVLDRDLDDVDAPVRAALRLGVYQLVEGVAPHAAVGETVGALAHLAPRAKGYANAVLRRVAALGPPWPWPEGDSVAAVGIRTSMPDWIVARLFADIGVDDARAALEIANEPASLTLRVNPRRATVDEVAAEVAATGANVERGALLPDALVVRGGGDPGQMAAVVDGRATPQDQGSQAIARAVGAQPGDRVLEVGAAPGGKVTAIAEAMGDDGLVVAVDVHPARLGLVTRAATRLGLDAVVGVAADGRRLPLAAQSFDRVLLDAPCSGFGVLRRRPEARWRIEPDAVDELAALQRELLLGAAGMVRPGGRLVYSVCTLTRAETVDVDEWARTALASFVADPPAAAPWKPWGRGALLLPQVAGTDGMYLLTLTRSADTEH